MTPKRPPSYRSLMAGPGITKLSNEDAFIRIGVLIDSSHAPRRGAGVTRALGWCDELEARGLTPAEASLLDYFRANAWDCRRPKNTKSEVWHWDQAPLQEEIYFLRRAATSQGFETVDHYRKCEILTNLGNLLNHIDRSIEAQEIWRQALVIDPEFWMARGNLGSGLERLARFHPDGVHGIALLIRAHDELVTALRDAEKYPWLGYPEAQKYFSKTLEKVDSIIDVEDARKSLNLDNNYLGKSKGEVAYRSWCLREALFLNIMNELGDEPVAAQDVLSLPPFVANLNDPPVLLGFFNQLKQEFVSARWTYFEAVQTHGVHFSDRDTFLVNTLDYPSYGLAVEKLRSSYRVAYSLFDKIAYFLNFYMRLGHKDQDVSFREVWRPKKGKGTRGVLTALQGSKNGPFRALYWVSKDLFEDSFKDVAQPDAIALHRLRINLEHRYTKVHEWLLATEGRQQPSKDIFVDTLAYSISRSGLEARVLRLLKLVRAALIYLCLGMQVEERRRARRRRSKRFLASQTLPTVDDRWKGKI